MAQQRVIRVVVGADQFERGGRFVTIGDVALGDISLDLVVVRCHETGTGLFGCRQTRQHREQSPCRTWGERTPYRLREPLETTDLGHRHEPATRPPMRTEVASPKQTPHFVR